MAERGFYGWSQPQRDVETSARLLKRLYLVEREVLRALGAWHISVGAWDWKNTLPRHAWHDSLHANTLRERVLELRYPRRDVDKDHDPQLEAFLAELTRAHNAQEFLLGIYEVVKPALLAAYESYLADADEIDDAPSRYYIEHILLDERRHAGEAAELLAGINTAEQADAAPWVEYLSLYLHAIGGLLGQGEHGELPSSHVCAGRAEYEIPRHAARDPRFLPATVHMPGRQPGRLIEHQVWNGINHANEMWAAEVPGTFMTRWPSLPWSFWVDIARWSYDEARHSLMGMRRMTEWGFTPGIDFPMVADHYHAVSDQDPIVALALLHQFEVGGPAWKQSLKTYYEHVGDVASSQDCDFDWADEAIHLRYGHTLLQHLLGPNSSAEQTRLMNEARADWNRWLTERWERGEDEYTPFMERIKARIAQAEEQGVPS